MAFGRTVEVSCSRCQRRYAVADHKVVGRRRTSRCRCGNLLIFDGRALSGDGLEGLIADVQPLEPTLTPSGAPAETGESSAPLSIPPLSIPAAPLPLELEAASAEPAKSSTAEPSADSQTIGRIRLRKTELRAADSASPGEAARESQRPRAPGTRVEDSASEPPESPRSLHEAFDSLDLDRLAESIRPTWEAPPSRRVTPPGEDPEVVVHYPVAWQPPPSERRRLRATWEVTPTLPLSFGPPPSDALDDDWETPATESPLATLPPAAASVAMVAAPTAEVSEHGPAATQLESASEPSPPTDANDAAPESAARVGKSGGPALDSTAPTAVTQPPAAAPPRSSAKLWGAGLAAAALLGLVWRGASTRATEEPATAAAPPARVSEASSASETLPASAALPDPATRPLPTRAPEAVDVAAPAPSTQVGVPTPDIPRETAVAHPASSPPAASPPAGAPSSAAAPRPQPSPAPKPAAAAATVARVPSPPNPAASEARDPEAIATPPEPPPASPGPDAGAVAQALAVAAARASACAASDAPAGSGSVRILLNPSGGVLNATALGAFQGTATGSCVEAQFRTASTPAYEGRTLSTQYSFSLNPE